jgi:glutaredoxin
VRLAARLAVSLACVAIATAPAISGCKRHADASAAGDAGAAPPFSVRDSSEGLLLTWIDERGDFHVEQKVTDVPLVGRDAVRVVDPTREEGTHAAQVFVADRRTARPDGTFPVRTMTRAAFDALAVARRAKNGPTLASAGTASANAANANAGTNGASNADSPQNNADPSPSARPAVIIYGASWCSACHDAEAYLKRKGIPYVEKDIEADPKAAREMNSKLARAGLRSGSIPVLDVRGRVMVGFNPREVDNALGQAM